MDGGPDHGDVQHTDEGLSLHAATRRFQQQMVRQALQRSRHNVSAAARALQITRAHMYNLMASFGIRRGEPHRSPGLKPAPLGRTDGYYLFSMRGLAWLGWDPEWAAAFAPVAAPELRPGRVVLEHGRFLRVHDGEAELLAVAAGRLRHRAASAADLPTVGDWVAIQHAPGEELAQIRQVLPRRSRFSRRRAGLRAVEQVVAANVDTVLLMMGLDQDFNLRRLERYLALAFASGASPVVVLNKLDLAGDLAGQRAAVEALRPGVPVLAIQLAGPGAGGSAGAQLAPFLAPGRTLALLGSSGVGKSTLLNHLAGADLQRIGGLRASDSRGRHTTTYAQLFALPGGALCIDTPGLREIQLWEADQGIGSAFEDVAAIVARCRFRDCRHEDEPDCAIRAALSAGALPAERYASFAKLRAEQQEQIRTITARGRRGRRR